MQRRPFSLAGHLVLLVLFCAGVIVLWLLPVILAGGFPIDPPTMLLPARNYVMTGLFSQEDVLGRLLSTDLIPTLGVPSTLDGRLSTLLFVFVSQWIPWGNWFGWLIVSSVLMAAALIPWWLAVRKLFDPATAWVSTIILALLPLYWREAIFLSNYPLSFFFLFCSFTAYAWFSERRPLCALALSGLLFGLSVSAKDAFLVFLPFLLLSYAWLNRQRWQTVIAGGAIFLSCMGLMYLLPYVGDLQRYGYPVNQNLARVWPTGGEAKKDLQNAIYLHLYPDPYTYRYDRERFDREYLLELQQKSFLERMQESKLLVNFGVGDGGPLLWLGSGIWIFLHNIPSLFQGGLVGGAFLWLFLLPGAVVLLKERRRFALLLFGFVVTGYAVINIILHYEREHLMDFGWAVALLAAIGIVAVSAALAEKWKVSRTVLICVITALIGFQLLQSNRMEFARRYAKSNVPWLQASAETVVAEVPASGVIAVPYHPNTVESFALLMDRTMSLFQVETVERLINEGKLAQAFADYGVTHVMGYGEELSGKMKEAVPALMVIVEIDPASVRTAVSPFTQYLLHVIR